MQHIANAKDKPVFIYAPTQQTHKNYFPSNKKYNVSASLVSTTTTKKIPNEKIEMNGTDINQACSERCEGVNSRIIWSNLPVR